jgi:hypothetical protein
MGRCDGQFLPLPRHGVAFPAQRFRMHPDSHSRAGTGPAAPIFAVALNFYSDPTSQDSLFQFLAPVGEASVSTTGSKLDVLFWLLYTALFISSSAADLKPYFPVLFLSPWIKGLGFSRSRRAPMVASWSHT